MIIFPAIKQEVLIACTIGIDDISADDVLAIYPNAVRNVLNMKLLSAKSGKVTIKIFNIYDQDIMTMLIEESEAGVSLINWSTESISAGVYFYKLMREENSPSVQGKFIVVK